MSRVRIVVEEFFRSFKKSILENVIMMVTFSISIIMAVIMCSYYFDLGDRYSMMTQNVGNSVWYCMDLMTESDSEITGSLTTASGCRNMMHYYDKLTSMEDYPVVSINTQQGVFARAKDIDNYFGDRDYTLFQTEWQTGAFMSSFGKDESCKVVNLQSAQVDLNAYRFFGLKVQEGEGFTEQNMKIDTASNSIPIVLGSNYKGIVEIGAVIDLSYWDRVYPCKVVGILEQGATLPDNGNVNIPQPCNLDFQILFPFGIQVSNESGEVDKLEKYAYLDYISLQNGMFQIDKHASMKDVVQMLRSTGAEHNLPPVYLVGVSMGVELLRKESKANIGIMSVMSIVLAFFVFYGIVVTFYNKIQVNSRTYGIFLMNGCSVKMILASCLIEIAVILLPAFLISNRVFSVIGDGVFHVDVVMRNVICFILVIFLVSAGFVTYMLRGVDTEYLIKQKE